MWVMYMFNKLFIVKIPTLDQGTRPCVESMAPKRSLKGFAIYHLETSGKTTMRKAHQLGYRGLPFQRYLYAKNGSNKGQIRKVSVDDENNS